MRQLADQVAIITGATSGIGRAVAPLFGRHGAKLILSGRDKSRGESLLSDLKQQGVDACLHLGDVANPDVNQELVELAIAEYGQLNIISTNAAVLGLGTVTGIDSHDFAKTFETNFFSIFHLCRAAFPVMLEGKGGAVVVNASIAASKAFPQHAAYCSSKAAAIALVKQLALDYGPTIRVNAISPGPVDTPLIWRSAAAFNSPDDAVKTAEESTALKRLGSPEEIARLVLYLASEESGWVTGSNLTIDGGITL